MSGLLYARDVAINDKIKIGIPLIGEILDNGEDSYYGLITVLTAMPIDVMVALDDAGIDFTEIDEYELFLRLFPQIRLSDPRILKMVFGELDLFKFQLFINEENGVVGLRDVENDIVIDRAIHDRIATTIRKIHHLKKDVRNPGNKSAKRYMLERARLKMSRNRKRAVESQLEPLIVSMVNTSEYKYDFDGTKKLTIYQFNESMRQVSRKINYDNRMYGVYAGTIDPKKLSQDEMTWLGN